MTPDEHYIRAEKIVAGVALLASIVDEGKFNGSAEDVFTVVSALTQEAMVHATLSHFAPDTDNGWHFTAEGNLEKSEPTQSFDFSSTRRFA